MRYSQLRAFHAVAEHVGFSAAAAALSQTQPALSDQVRNLEQAHDVLLFHRSHRRVTLTEKGAELYAMTRRFFEVEDGIAAYLRQSGSVLDGQLRIVADAVQHITPALASFRAAHPNVRISMHTGNTDTVLARLRNYDAEIGVVGRLDPGKDLEVRDLGSTAIVAVVAVDGPHAGIGSFNATDLGKLPIVMREPGSRTRASIEAEAARRKIRLRPVIEVEGREAMREVVATGAGIGFVSEAELGNDKRLKRVTITGARMQMPEAAVYLANRRDVPVIRAFLRSLDAVG